MSALDREVNAVQNPALGAVVLWRFACGYQFASQLGEPAPFARDFFGASGAFRRRHVSDGRRDSS